MLTKTIILVGLSNVYVINHIFRSLTFSESKHVFAGGGGGGAARGRGGRVEIEFRD